MRLSIFLLLFILHFPNSITRSVYDFAGFPLRKLIQRHVDEEKLVQIFEHKLPVLQSIRRIIQTYLRLPTEMTMARHGPMGRQKSVLLGMLGKLLADQSTRTRLAITSGELAKPLTYDLKKEGALSFDMFLFFSSWRHLQDMYLINPQNLSWGLTLESRNGGKLYGAHAIEIAMYNLFQSRPSQAVQWLEVALNDSLDVAKQVDLTMSMNRVTIQQHNKARSEARGQGVETGTKHLKNFFSTAITPISSNSNMRKPMREFHFDKHKKSVPKPDVLAQFMDLCMGKNYQDRKKKNMLKCYIDQKRHPYFAIRPLEVEELTDTPPLWQLYNVIGEKMTSRIKQIRVMDLVEEVGTGGLGPGCVYNRNTPTSIYKFGEILTGLRFSRCREHVDFAEYTAGRMAWTHNDHTGGLSPGAVGIEELEIYGDYLATLLFYLETPTGGGETPFMSDGVSGQPVRGSALFWYNMHFNGDLRKDTIHGSCPVIYGEKIVFTQFYRYNINWDKRKCSLDPLE